MSIGLILIILLVIFLLGGFSGRFGGYGYGYGHGGIGVIVPSLRSRLPGTTSLESPPTKESNF